jgi:hypothetical protein
MQSEPQAGRTPHQVNVKWWQWQQQHSADCGHSHGHPCGCACGCDGDQCVLVVAWCHKMLNRLSSLGLAPLLDDDPTTICNHGRILIGQLFNLSHNLSAQSKGLKLNRCSTSVQCVELFGLCMVACLVSPPAVSLAPRCVHGDTTVVTHCSGW